MMTTWQQGYTEAIKDVERLVKDVSTPNTVARNNLLTGLSHLVKFRLDHATEPKPEPEPKLELVYLLWAVKSPKDFALIGVLANLDDINTQSLMAKGMYKGCRIVLEPCQLGLLADMYDPQVEEGT